MLTFYYESGNDEVAVSNRNIESKVKEAIASYKKFPTHRDTLIISQVDMINALGRAIFDEDFEESIDFHEVCIVVEDLNKTFHFDEEGILTESWYEAVPYFNY